MGDFGLHVFPFFFGEPHSLSNEFIFTSLVEEKVENSDHYKIHLFLCFVQTLDDNSAMFMVNSTVRMKLTLKWAVGVKIISPSQKVFLNNLRKNKDFYYKICNSTVRIKLTLRWAVGVKIISASQVFLNNLRKNEDFKYKMKFSIFKQDVIKLTKDFDLLHVEL